MTDSRRVAVNTVSQVAGKIITAGSTFLISYLLARTYGPAGYGDFTKITAFVTLWYLFADFGMNAVYLRDEGYAWSHLFTIRTAISILLLFVALSVLVFLPTGAWSGYTPGVKLGILLFAISIVVQGIITSANAVFQKKLRYELPMLAATAGSLLTLAMIWVVTKSLLPQIAVNSSVVSLLTGSVLTALISLRLVHTYSEGFISSEWGKMKRLFMKSLPLGVTLLFNVVYFRADTIILTMYRSTEEVGIYGLVYKIFELPLAIPTFFMNAAYPVILSRFRQSEEGARTAIMKTALALGIGSVIFAVCLWLTAPAIVWIRPDFAPGIMPLRILSLGMPFFYGTSLSMWLLIIRRQHTALVTVYGFAMLANIAANRMFIPVHGYMAAAWITVLSEAIVFLSSIYVLNSHSERREV